jgi:hypothetical protein
MSGVRATFWNVHFYDASTGTRFGGFYQHGSLTEANLLSILADVLLVLLDQPFTVKHRDSGRIIKPSSRRVELGNYDISSTGKQSISPQLKPP